MADENVQRTSRSCSSCHVARRQSRTCRGFGMIAMVADKGLRQVFYDTLTSTNESYSLCSLDAHQSCHRCTTFVPRASKTPGPTAPVPRRGECQISGSVWGRPLGRPPEKCPDRVESRCERPRIKECNRDFSIPQVGHRSSVFAKASLVLLGSLEDEIV